MISVISRAYAIFGGSRGLEFESRRGPFSSDLGDIATVDCFLRYMERRSGLPRVKATFYESNECVQRASQYTLLNPCHRKNPKLTKGCTGPEVSLDS